MIISSLSISKVNKAARIGSNYHRIFKFESKRDGGNTDILIDLFSKGWRKAIRTCRTFSDPSIEIVDLANNRSGTQSDCDLENLIRVEADFQKVSWN